MSPRRAIQTVRPSGTLAPAAASARRARVAEEAERLVEASRADNSRRAYDADIAHFAAWCAGLGLSAFPASPQTVAAYFTALSMGEAEPSDTGRAPRQAHWSGATIMRRKSSIGRVHRLAGMDDPTRDERVLTVLKGIRRAVGMAQERRRPLLAEHIAAVAALWAGSDPRNARDVAILTMGFGGAFRRQDVRGLAVGDVERAPEGLRVTLRHRKTDQEGRGTVLGLVPARDRAACPVAAWSAWTTVLAAHAPTPPAPGEPLFRAVAGPGAFAPRPMDWKAVESIVRRAARALGLEPMDEYGGHSLRAGFVTSAARAGKDLQWIMAQTGHRSPDMVLRYIREARIFVDNAGAGLL